MPVDSTAGAGRYAPSPSGDLHLGNLRTALISWLFARSTGRKFCMRIDDLDRARDSGAAQQQLADLAALGIDWDGEVMRQSDRAAAYDRALASLSQRDLVYTCTCSRKDIQAAPTAPHAPPGAYPGTCRDLTDAERERRRDRIAPRAPALRLRVPTDAEHREHLGIHRDGTIDFTDALLGRSTGAVDDLVLRRGDGTVAYHLAAVVDDAHMGIDQVVRGSDLASSTPRQILLQRLLGYTTPTYAHVPLVLGPTGQRLAKRDGAVTLADLRARNVSADDVLQMLAVSLGLAGGGEHVTAQVLRARFDVKNLATEAWVWHPSGLH